MSNIQLQNVQTKSGLKINGGNVIQPSMSYYKGYFNGTTVPYTLNGPNVFPTFTTLSTNMNPTIVKNGASGTFTVPANGTGVWSFSSWVFADAGVPVINVFVSKFANNAALQNGNNSVMFGAAPTGTFTFSASSFLSAGDQISVTYAATASCNLTIYNLSIAQLTQTA